MSVVTFSAGSLGDILATAGLIVQIARVVYCNRKVSEDCDALSIELQSLHGTLLLLDNSLERCRSTPLEAPIVRLIQPEIAQCHLSLSKFSRKLEAFRLSLSSTSIANLWRKVVWVGSAEAASLSSTLSSHRLKLVMLLISLNSVGLMEGTITCLSGAREHLSKEPGSIGHIKEKLIGVVHPLGVTIPIPTWACTTWESVHYIISNYSRNRIGERYIERGDYQIVRPESDTAVDHSKFAQVVREEETVEMGIIFRSVVTAKDDQCRCPRCRHLNMAALPDGGWITCDICCGRFQINNNMRIDFKLEETSGQIAHPNTPCKEDMDHKNDAGETGHNNRSLPEKKVEPNTELDEADLKYFRRIILEVRLVQGTSNGLRMNPLRTPNARKGGLYMHHIQQKKHDEQHTPNASKGGLYMYPIRWKIRDEQQVKRSRSRLSESIRAYVRLWIEGQKY